ncbi:hypothetical protein LOK49_LG01G02475 [Camellia lanceoleosa]|uniref:Uncharacterized protein n=1 Tax=Camellia lanceoleosa TaxID=1840588 RepID=A0ACC0IZW6_9ERIC|nr:hypothetical protein LOK49_LG01G02475 [Camellia lanceoleosa]
MKKRDIDETFSPTPPSNVLFQLRLKGRDISSAASPVLWSVMTNPHVEYKILDEITTILRETREKTQIMDQEPLALTASLVYLKAKIGGDFKNSLAEIVVETIDENGVGTVRGEYMACSLADEQCDDHRREGTQLNECLNEITRALLQADVQFKLVRDMQTNIKKTVNLDDLAARHNKRKIIQLEEIGYDGWRLDFVRDFGEDMSRTILKQVNLTLSEASIGIPQLHTW